MKRKSVLSIFVVVILLLTCMFTACNSSSQDSNNNESSNLWTIEKVYAEAKEKGFEGSLEDLIALFKGDQGIQGEKGDKGDQGVGVEDIVINDAGELVIVLTNKETINCGIVKPPVVEENEYVFKNDKNLLRFVILMEEQKILLDDLTAEFKTIEVNDDKLYFTYDEVLNVCMDNIEQINLLLDNDAEIFNSAMLVSRYCSDVYNAYHYYAQTMVEMRGPASDFFTKIEVYSTNLENALNDLKLYILSESYYDLEEYKKIMEETAPEEVSKNALKDFIETTNILALKLNELEVEFAEDNIILESWLLSQSYESKLVNNYMHRMDSLFLTLEQMEYNSKVREVYTEICHDIKLLYVEVIDVDNYNEVEINEINTRINNNISILELFQEII